MNLKLNFYALVGIVLFLQAAFATPTDLTLTSSDSVTTGNDVKQASNELTMNNNYSITAGNVTLRSGGKIKFNNVQLGGKLKLASNSDMDETGPSLSLSVPASNFAETNLNPVFAGSFTDESYIDESNTKIYIDGVERTGVQYINGAFSFTEAFSEGNYSFKLVSQDLLGNESQLIRNFTVLKDDNPIVFNEEYQIVLAESTPQITGSMIDDFVEADTKAYIDGVDQTYYLDFVGNDFVFDNFWVSDGLHELKIETKDSLGNLYERTFIFVKDLTGPKVTLTSPSLGTVFYGTQSSPFVLSGNVIDEYDIQTGDVKLYSDKQFIQDLTLVDGNFSINFNYILGPGGHNIKVVSTDSLGNESTHTLFIHVDNWPQQVYDDFVNPVITVNSHTQNEILTDPQVTISGDATDNNGIKSLKINGVEIATANGPFSTQLTLDEGFNAVLFEAEDIFNNVATYELTLQIFTGGVPKQELFEPVAFTETYSTGGNLIVFSGEIENIDIQEIRFHRNPPPPNAPAYISTTDIVDDRFELLVPVDELSTSVDVEFISGVSGVTSTNTIDLSIDFNLVPEFTSSRYLTNDHGINGGDLIEIVGKNFRTGMQGTIGGNSIPELVIINESLATAKTPASLSIGWVDIELENIIGNTNPAISENAFPYRSIVSIPNFITHTTDSTMVLDADLIGVPAAPGFMHIFNSEGTTEISFTTTSSISEQINLAEGRNIISIFFDNPPEGPDNIVSFTEVTKSKVVDTTPPVVEINGFDGQFDDMVYDELLKFDGRYTEDWGMYNIKVISKDEFDNVIDSVDAEYFSGRFRCDGVRLNYGLNYVTVEATDAQRNMGHKTLIVRRIVNMTEYEIKVKKWEMIAHNSRNVEHHPWSNPVWNDSPGKESYLYSLKNAISHAAGHLYQPNTQSDDFPYWMTIKDYYKDQKKFIFNETPQVDNDGYLIDDAILSELDTMIGLLEPYVKRSDTHVPQPIGDVMWSQYMSVDYYDDLDIEPGVYWCTSSPLDTDGEDIHSVDVTSLGLIHPGVVEGIGVVQYLEKDQEIDFWTNVGSPCDLDGDGEFEWGLEMPYRSDSFEEPELYNLQSNEYPVSGTVAMVPELSDSSGWVGDLDCDLSYLSSAYLADTCEEGPDEPESLALFDVGDGWRRISEESYLYLKIRTEFDVTRHLTTNIQETNGKHYVATGTGPHGFTASTNIQLVGTDEDDIVTVYDGHIKGVQKSGRINHDGLYYPIFGARATVEFKKETLQLIVVDPVYIEAKSDKVRSEGSFGKNPEYFEGGSDTHFGYPDTANPYDSKERPLNEKVLNLQFKYFRNASNVADDFDVDLRVVCKPQGLSESDVSVTWSLISGPNFGSFNHTDKFKVKYQFQGTQKKPGLYVLQCDILGNKSIANVLLPGAGGEVKDWLTQEVDFVYLQALNWRTDVQNTAIANGENQTLFLLKSWIRVASKFFDYQGIAPIQGQTTPRYNFIDEDRPNGHKKKGNGDFDEPSYVTINGIVIHASKITNLFYAIFGRTIGYSELAIRSGAYLNAGARKKIESAEAQESITIGFKLYDAYEASSSLDDEITAEKVIKMQTKDENNDNNLWPVYDVPTQNLEFPDLPTDYNTLNWNVSLPNWRDIIDEFGGD